MKRWESPSPPNIRRLQLPPISAQGYVQRMPSYVFTSTKHPTVCMVSDDPTGDSLPLRLGPWVRTDAPWNGQHAGFVAGIRELLETREDQARDDEPPPLRP